MNNKNENQKNRIPTVTRTELAVVATLGVLNTVVLAVLVSFTSLDVLLTTLAVCFLYLLEIALIGIRHKEEATEVPSVELSEFLEESGSVVLKNSATPAMIINRYGTVLWYNDAMHTVLDGDGNYIGKSVGDLFGLEEDELTFDGQTVSFCNSLYKLQGFAVSDNDEGLYVMEFTDVTELVKAKALYDSERVAVAYIAIDNVEDVLQYVHEKFRDAVSVVDDKIKNWVRSMDGVIKSYDNDKYIAIFDSAHLDECIENRFDILDIIRDTRVGDGVSVTASIGVSKIEGTLSMREEAARAAIDMALERGGDQAVYKTDSSVEYYGGRTKSVYKRSNVRSRTFTNQLMSEMARSDNVIVMGHRYGDFDSFGASVGIVRLATLCGLKVNIAVDVRDKNLYPLMDMMQTADEYAKIFIDSAEATDLLSPDTLVVLVDHNSFDRSQFSDIAKKVNNVAVIDHHRKSGTLPDSVKLSYIEPSASSTCELVSEMLENAVSSQFLLKQEADILLAGILLDTKQFTRNTGTRTFGSARYLRGAGANPSDVYSMFKTDPEDLSKEARFHTSITVYKENIAISSCDGDTDESYRIIASKAADKMLTLKGIEAAFTVVRIGEQIHISGRSGGKINVQLILEKLGGGGHFDIAGAQVVSDSVLSVLESLKSSIDEYLEETEK